MTKKQEWQKRQHEANDAQDSEKDCCSEQKQIAVHCCQPAYAMPDNTQT